MDTEEHLPGEPRGYRVQIRSERTIKQKAIAAHASQMSSLIEDDPTGFRFTAETLAPFMTDYEYVLEIPS